MENTGDEIETSSLNITLAIAVPKKARIKIYPNEFVTEESNPIDNQGKSDKKSIKIALQKIGLAMCLLIQMVPI